MLQGGNFPPTVFGNVAGRHKALIAANLSTG
jgi:hypothetical protein